MRASLLCRSEVMREGSCCDAVHRSNHHGSDYARIRRGCYSDMEQFAPNHLFYEAVTSPGKSIRSQLAVFLHDKHARTSDPLGDPRDMKEPDSLGG